MTMIRHHSDERGAAAILFAVFLVVLVGMTAMVVDLGYAYYSKQRLQDALDLATIAAARELDGQSGYAEAARVAAAAVMNREYSDEGGFAVSIGCGPSSSPGVAHLCIGGYNVTRDAQGNLPAVSERFRPNDAAQDAARMFGQAQSPSFFARIFEVDVIDVGAVSTAVKSGGTLAQLTIRSSLANINTANSALLGPILGLLGGNVNLSAVSWSGLVGANINLLDFFDEMIENGGLGISLAAGDYTGLLSTSVQVSRVLGAAVDAVGVDSAAGLALTALNQRIATGVKSASIVLGDLISVAAGTPSSGLDTSLNLLDLVQGTLLAANGANALSTSGVTLSTAGVSSLLTSLGGSMSNYPALSSLISGLAPLTNILGGAATVTLRLSVIEPPQLSAIGDPADAKIASDQRSGVGAIYVRTGQVRLYISIQLPVLTGLSSLLSAVTTLNNSTSLVNILNNLLSLNIFGVLGDVLGALLPIPQAKKFLDIAILPSPRLDISLDVGYGEAYVTDYSCTSGPNTLSIAAGSSAASARVGTIDPNTVFSSTVPPSVKPVAIIDIGTKNCTVTCLLIICSSNCQPRVPLVGGGLGFFASTSVLGNSYSHTYSGLPELREPPLYHSFSLSGLVGSLKTTLSGIKVEAYQPAPGNANLIGTLLTGVGGLITTVVNILNPVITLLAALLDPIVDFLLRLLGLNLAAIDVGANLTCSSGARLVN